MTLKLTWTHPDMPKGEEGEIRGVGLVKNGSSVTLNEEQERNAIAVLGMSVKDFFKDSEQVKVEGTSEVKVSEVDIPDTGGGET